MHEPVCAPVNYLVPTGEKPVTHIRPPGTDTARRDADYREVAVTIRDGREDPDRFTLEREGFVFARRDTAVTNFFDDAEVKAVYYPEVEQLVADCSGASEVLVFDHTIRVNQPAIQTTRKVREPVLVAHNDYTDRSAPQRVRDLLPAERAAALLEHRFAVVQTWRPISGPVRDMPLAICDAGSIASRDLIETDLVYENRVGEVLQLSHNPDHRWFYFPDMEPREALVFKCYDSLTDGRARFTAHTAFAHPDAPADAPPRQSIEARTLAFFAPRQERPLSPPLGTTNTNAPTHRTH